MAGWVSQVLWAITSPVSAVFILRKLRGMLRYKQLLHAIPGPEPGWILGSATEYCVRRECQKFAMMEMKKTGCESNCKFQNKICEGHSTQIDGVDPETCRWTLHKTVNQEEMMTQILLYIQLKPLHQHSRWAYCAARENSSMQE